VPHAVLNGKASIEDVFRELKPLFIRNQNIILKTEEVYLERNRKDILIDSLAIENGKKTLFLAMISGRDGSVVVRLYPNIAVDKTDGIKKILAELAKQLLQTFRELELGETNLDDYLK
jgi:hypothetical protein